MSATEKVRQFLSENPGAVVNGRWVEEMLEEYDQMAVENRKLKHAIDGMEIAVHEDYISITQRHEDADKRWSGIRRFQAEGVDA